MGIKRHVIILKLMVHFNWRIRQGSTSIFRVRVMVKQSHYRPGQALRVPGGWGSQISTQSPLESGKFVSPHAPTAFNLRKYSWYSFLLEAESTPGPEGLCQWKIPMTPPEFEPATFRLVAQCLNQLRHRFRVRVGEHISGTMERVGRQCELLRDLNVHHPHMDKRDWSLLLNVMSVRMGGRRIRV